MIAGEELKRGDPVTIGPDGKVYKLVISDTNEGLIASRNADNAYTPIREAALKRFVEKLEAAAAEVVEGPISAMTANGTRFMTGGFGGWKEEGQTSFIIRATELDGVIDAHLDNLAEGIIRTKMSGPTRLVWRKRPELHADGPVSDAEAVRYHVAVRDHAVIWLRFRVAFEPTGFE